jgi:hypothetical protein
MLYLLVTRSDGEVPIKAVHGIGGVTIDPQDKPYAKISICYRPKGMKSLSIRPP